MTYRPIVLLFLLPLLAPLPAVAQRNLDIDRYVPPADRDGFIGFQGTHTPGPWRWNVELFGTWARRPLVLRMGDGFEETTETVILGRGVGDLVAQVGLGGRLGLALDVPLLAYQQGDASLLLDDGGALSANALGDPRLFARYRFYGEDSTVEHERSEGPGVAVLVGSTVPVGQQDVFLGEGAARVDGQLIADYHILGAGAGVFAGYRHRFSPRDFFGVRFRDELSFGAGLKVPTSVVADLCGLVEIRGTTDAGDPFGDSSRTYLEGDVGLRLVRGQIALTGAVGTGFARGVGEPEVRTVLGVSWAPRIADSDGDLIPDDRDECEHLAEDFDGFEDSDGCDDPDNDNDFILDADDRCPNEAAEEGRDADENGCTDPPRDSDGDSIDDAADSCAEQPEDVDGFEDADGCPDPDNDGDAIADTADLCPFLPEDRDGFQDDDGCPDLDNDADGVPDAQDLCPLIPEDRDGTMDEDGCPDPDNDRDGVIDGSDTCPDAREDIDGVADTDGCPEPGGRAAWTIEARRCPPWEATITGSLRFGADDQLQPRMSSTLDQLAALLIARWPVRYLVELGSPTGNEEVVLNIRGPHLQAALEARGVPADRLRVSWAVDLRAATVRVTAETMDESTRRILVRDPTDPTRPSTWQTPDCPPPDSL